MFGIGMPELLLILAVALIVIGPKKLPDLAKSMGKALGEFKRATNDLKETIEQETGLNEVRESFRDANRGLQHSFDADDRRASSVLCDSEAEADLLEAETADEAQQQIASGTPDKARQQTVVEEKDPSRKDTDPGEDQNQSTLKGNGP